MTPSLGFTIVCLLGMACDEGGGQAEALPRPASPALPATPEPSGPALAPAQSLEEATLRDGARDAAVVARQLVSDVDSGFFATFEAIRIGERIVPAIFKASEDFKKTHSRNLGWCAELFCVVKSKDSVESFRALTRREKRLVRLLGLIGLASNGALENPKETEEEWIRLLAGREESDLLNEPFELSILGLGQIGSERALDCLHSVLAEERASGHTHLVDYACDALGYIRSKRSIEPLRECLKDREFESAGNAFAALIAIGDVESVPLAIARLGPRPKHGSGELVALLCEVSGESHGESKAEWEQWWQGRGADWRIPERLRGPSWLTLRELSRQALKQRFQEEAKESGK